MGEGEKGRKGEREKGRGEWEGESAMWQAENKKPLPRHQARRVKEIR